MKSEDLYDNVMSLIKSLCNAKPRDGFEIEYLEQCNDLLELYRELLDKLNTRKIENVVKTYNDCKAYTKYGNNKLEKGKLKVNNRIATRDDDGR